MNMTTCTACPPPPAVALFWGLLLACAGLWLLALALLTAAALRDRWRAWRRGSTAEPDDGGPEVDRLIVESMAAWRADVAERIWYVLQARGLLIPETSRYAAQPSVAWAAKCAILEELERSDHAD
jgi:hypothetical protein